MWMPVAITAMIFAVGNILFGHFEERTPKWKRVAKVGAGTRRGRRNFFGARAIVGTCPGCTNARRCGDGPPMVASTTRY
jgi:hypothetical protein